LNGVPSGNYEEFIGAKKHLVLGVGEKIMRLAIIIIILAILAGFVAGIVKELFPALHDDH
jgi:hypothetical protein